MFRLGRSCQSHATSLADCPVLRSYSRRRRHRGKKISPETECSRRELLIEDTRPGISGMDGRTDHTPILWQIAQFSDLTEDAEDICPDTEVKKGTIN